MTVPSNKAQILTKSHCPSDTLPSQSMIDSSFESQKPKKISPSSSSQNLSQPESQAKQEQDIVSSGQKSLIEKPLSKKKPLPPPRATSVTKTNELARDQCSSNKEKFEKESDKKTVSCGLCGADVGLGPGIASTKAYLRNSFCQESSSDDQAEGSSSSKQVSAKLKEDLEKQKIEQENSESSPLSSLPEKK